MPELPKVDKAGKPTKAVTVGEKYPGLAKQCAAEWNLSWEHQQPKIAEAEVRLKLYNNQKRAKKDIGDTTLFTIFQTVFASLFVDRLTVKFGGKEDGDEEVADNLNMMAESDYTDMEKDELDLDWIWNVLFFGRAVVGLHEYERDKDNNIFLPIPFNIIVKILNIVKVCF